MQITGQIQSVQPKRSGTSVKNGRNISWTIYEVMINGQSFSTFDNTFLNMVGQSGTYEYESQTVNKNGRQFVNNTLTNLNKGKGGGGSALAAKLDSMDKKLDAILQQLQGGSQQSFEESLVPPADQGPEEEIDVSQIPF